jgi:hypothetical protein
MCSGAKNQVVFVFLYLLQSTVPNYILPPNFSMRLYLCAHCCKLSWDDLAGAVNDPPAVQCYSDSTGHAQGTHGHSPGMEGCFPSV